MVLDPATFDPMPDILGADVPLPDLPTLRLPLATLAAPAATLVGIGGDLVGDLEDAAQRAYLRRAMAAAFGPWAERYAASTREVRLRELWTFLLFCRSRYLAIPAELRAGMVEDYAAWLDGRVAAGTVAGSTARRRVATARAAMRWRGRTLDALGPVA